MENTRSYTATDIQDEFMKRFVIDGINLREKFMDRIGKKVRVVGIGR